MKNPKMSCSAGKAEDQICPAAKHLTDCSAECRSDSTYVLPHPGLSLPALIVAGHGKVGTSNLSSRRDLRLLLDFGRRGLEEKPSTGCPRKERQAKGLSKERCPFSHLRSPSVTSWSRSAWKQGVTSSHTSPRCFMRKHNRQVRRAHRTRCGDYCSPNPMSDVLPKIKLLGRVW